MNVEYPAGSTDIVKPKIKYKANSREAREKMKEDANSLKVRFTVERLEGNTKNSGLIVSQDTDRTLVIQPSHARLYLVHCNDSTRAYLEVNESRLQRLTSFDKLTHFYAHNLEDGKAYKILCTPDIRN